MRASDDDQLLARAFEAHRGHLRAVAYRMLGSEAEADDAVQEAWVRLSRSDTSAVENLGGWLTTVVSRVCLNVLRSRRTRDERPLDDGGPGGDAVAAPADAGPAAAGPQRAPEDEAVLADSVGLALQVVLDTLTPAERLAFVLHDLFAMPFDEIAPIVGRAPAATRQLASRARRRVQGARATVAGAPSAVDVAGQRRVVEAFLAAARGGDLDGLLAVLSPDVVLHADDRPGVHGARQVASGALVFSARAQASRPAIVDGTVGVVLAPAGEVEVAMVMTFDGDRIVAVHVVTDPARLATLDIVDLPA
jgi:RNA polymerase sigma-70 factor (ECF subfamily)